MNNLNFEMISLVMHRYVLSCHNKQWLIKDSMGPDQTSPLNDVWYESWKFAQANLSKISN